MLKILTFVIIAGYFPFSHASDIKVQMNQMKGIIQELTVLSSSERLFEDKDQSKKIEELISGLKNSSHDLNTNLAKSKDNDPTLQYIANMFRQEVSRAESAFKNGNKSYARSVVRSLTQSCIACHSKGDTGNQFNTKPESTANLSTFEKLQFFAATRSVDPALELAVTMAADAKFLKEKSNQWEQALRTGLALAIRVKGSVADAKKLVEAAQKNSELTKKEKDMLAAWNQDLNSALIQKTVAAKLATPKQIAQLRKMSDQRKDFFSDPKGDVVHFALTRVIHQGLSNTPKLKQNAKDLLWLGEAYESLRDLNLWGLHDWYYLACVERAMGSDLARTCFDRYENSVRAGYTGTAGESIPTEIRDSIQKLKTQIEAPAAKPQKKQ